VHATCPDHFGDFWVTAMHALPIPQAALFLLSLFRFFHYKMVTELQYNLSTFVVFRDKCLLFRSLWSVLIIEVHFFPKLFAGRVIVLHNRGRFMDVLHETCGGLLGDQFILKSLCLVSRHANHCIKCFCRELQLVYALFRFPPERYE